MDWFYYNERGEKVGPISASVLKELVKCGVIKHHTVIANSNGRTQLAGETNGLEFPVSIVPLVQNDPPPISVVPVPKPTKTQPVYEDSGFAPSKSSAPFFAIIFGFVFCCFIIIVVIAGIANRDKLFTPSSSFSSSNSSGASSSSKITMSAYNQVKEGMSYREVVEILGSPTETAVDFEFADSKVTSCIWEAKNSSILGDGAISIVFDNDKVVQKFAAGIN